MRIYIDCTITFNCTHNTGIQRVVRNIVRESKSVGQQLGVKCTTVKFDGNNFRTFAPKTDRKVRILLVLMGKILKGISKLSYFLKRFLPATWYSKLSLILSPHFIYLYSIYQKEQSESGVILNSKRDYASENHNINITEASDHNILLLLDSNWDVKIWDAVEKFRDNGGHVCAVLFDLIPFSHPETVEKDTLKAHTSWWIGAPLHVDSVMCISKSVRDDFLLWQERHDLTRKLMSEKVGYFYLGANFDKPDLFNQVLTSHVPNFLVVGTLEPRKNHNLILDAFDILWTKKYQINLVIVGSIGWKSKKLLDRIQKHPEFRHRLFLIKDTSDHDLTLLYSKSEALIIASLAEGFGLPIVEAFQHETKVICSDIPVFREVAGDHAVYFDPTNPANLANKVSESTSSQRNGRYQKKSVTKEWISWKESTEQLLTRVIAITTNSEKSPELSDDNDLS